MEQKLTVANKVAYGMSDFGNNLVFVAATNYLMFYYTDVASISLAATGILFLVVRIFDAFAGPIFGILVDKTQTRFGKVRPWFLWMAVPYAVSAVLLFSIAFFPVNARLPLAYATYAIFTICFAGLGTAINAILPSLSGDANERASANMFRNVLGQFGGLISGLAILPLVSLFGGLNSPKGFTIAMGIFAVILVMAEVFTFTNVRENVTPAQEKPVPLHDSIKALLPNGPWWTIIGQGVLYVAAQSLMFVMTAETVDYGEWRFGVRAQGLLTSVSAIGASIGAGLAGVINSDILAHFHFVPNMTQTASGIMGINVCFVYGPAIIDAICIISIMFYGLDKLSAKMHADLQAKRQDELNEGVMNS